MKIALDYDETYTADPILWDGFVQAAIRRGHEVCFVTFRSSDFPPVMNEDIEMDALSLGIKIIYTGGKQKSTMFDADIWIDDSPVLIPKKEDLLDMYNGCLAWENK